MSIRGKFQGKSAILRYVIEPIFRLASQVQVKKSSGCFVYQLAREMANRVASNPTDKVFGLLYLLRANILPTYDEAVSTEFVWKRCFYVLPFGKKLKILFDFPYGTAQQWFPTWKQLMEWPQHDPSCEHSPTKWPRNWRVPETMEVGEMFFISGAWAISGILHVAEENEYILKSGDKDLGFYGPYLSQVPIEVSGQQFTLVVLSVVDFSNLVVCKQVAETREMRKSNNGTEKWMNVVYLQKAGVLRADYNVIRVKVWS